MSIATFVLILITTLPTASEAGGSAGPARPVILDFTATWCGPCRQMKPVVEQLARQGFPIKAVDLDEHRELAEKYQVEAVPTFIVVDPSDGRELGRISGVQPAETLSTLYQQSVAKVSRRAPAEPRREEPVAAEDDDPAADQPEGPPKEAPRVNPKPWETVVRIKVHGQGSIGFGSGTIIHSTPTESIILTCAHIFKLERGPQATPSRFPRKITIDLFDGVLGGPKNNQVHYSNESVVGEALDYDFTRDVGLIRIRPGRRLAFARVVPPHWTPKAGMIGLYTVGCSEGHDATTWKTRIVNPAFHGLAGKPSYEAIECVIAPRQGRSGGGLFTEDGYVVGVCDFAEPTGNHGLYASPRSIYHLLNRNNLVALYDSRRGRGDALVAARTPRRVAPEASNEPMIARGQSPGRDDPGAVSLPPPGMLGIKPPLLVREEGRLATSRRGGWIATPSVEEGNTAELKMAPSTDPDPFHSVEPTGADDEQDRAAETSAAAPISPRSPSSAPPRRSSGSKWRPGREPLPELSIPSAR